MKTKNILKTILSVAVLGLFGALFLTAPRENVSAAVPMEYRPNYKFASQREKIEEIIYTINATRVNGQAVSTSYFSTLSTLFNVVFSHLPQNKVEYKEVYEICRIGAETLSREYSNSQLSNFQNRCLIPLQDIFDDIKENSSVKAVIVANPDNWSAPLTVTFSADQSVDNSATIPSNGYYWYFTNTDGVEQAMGQWIEVTHTFATEGRYIIHLTVRSINEWIKWVFDGEATTVVLVWPQAANIYISANARKMNEYVPLKFTSQEATDWIILDGSATTPLGTRVIQNHIWTITDASSKQRIHTVNGVGSPSSIRFKFPPNGYYNVTLEVTDNQKKSVSKTYPLIIADPIAQIKITPEDGNTTSIHTFDASTSYSVQSTIKSYVWIVTDADGNTILRERSKSIQHKFERPGIYRVRLQVEDQIGNQNEEVATLNVASTPPVPQFVIEPTKQRRLPSQYRLDASASYDIDTQKGWDSISYDWSFSNNENVSIDETVDGWKRVKISFKEKGTYQVTLTVKDNYGQLQQNTRTINVESSLRPSIRAVPIATKLGTDTTFVVDTNKPIASYSWDFGDGQTRILQENKVIHRYKRVGSYKVKLTVSTVDGETNDITMSVFIGEANAPIPVFSITNGRSETLIPEEACIDEGGNKVDAFSVERYEAITINGRESVNVKWGTENLAFYFKPQWASIIRNMQFQNKFDELGCRFIDMTVEDTAINKTATTRIRFFVNNASPKLQNLTMSFPQMGSAYGIGIGQNTQTNDLFKSDIDPIVIRLDAVGVRDNDGTISTYRWYYYNVDDPDRILEIKYTPASLPYVYFTLPRLPGEYRFAVEITDNDGITTNSEKLLGNWPVVFFPPSATAPDIPMVTLKIDKPNVKVGEIVTLEAIAKITSERPDFASQRTISYDFDGDGTRDTTTKDSKITYVYKNTGSFTPRVKVNYRWYSGIANAERINVEKWVKAWFLYATVGNTLVVRDASYGDIENRKFCADARQCKVNTNWLVENQTYFKKDYAATGKYVVKYDVKAKNGEENSASAIVELQNPSTDPGNIGIVTLPAPGKDGKVSIGEALENKVLFYVEYDGSGDCYVDTDISRDSTTSGQPDQNRDISCNTVALFEYKNQTAWSTIARVYFEQWWQLLTKDISVEFIDINIEIPADQQEIYTLITTTIENLPDNQPEIRSILVLLRSAILAGDDTSSLVLQLHSVYEVKKAEIDVATTQQIDSILAKLSNRTTVSALGGTAYETAKQSIFAAMPSTRKPEVEKIFSTIENAAGDVTTIKTNLFKIPEIGYEEVQKGTLTDVDMDNIQIEVCKIVEYYNISWTTCKTADGETIWAGTETPITTESWSIAKSLFKWILIVVWVIGVVFLALVVVFAVKAKKKEWAQG